MSSLSLLALQEIQRRTGQDVWIGLVTIKTSAGAPMLRLAVNNEDVTSNGNVYSARFVDVVVQDIDGSEQPEATLAMDAVDRTITQGLASLNEPPLVDIAYVLSSALDDVVWSVSDLVMRSYRVSLPSIVARLQSQDYLNEPSPGRRMDSTNTPAIFLQ